MSDPYFGVELSGVRLPIRPPVSYYGYPVVCQIVCQAERWKRPGIHRPPLVGCSSEILGGITNTRRLFGSNRKGCLPAQSVTTGQALHPDTLFDQPLLKSAPFQIVDARRPDLAAARPPAVTPPRQFRVESRRVNRPQNPASAGFGVTLRVSHGGPRSAGRPA